MTAIESYSKPQRREPGGSAKRRRRWFKFSTALSASGALGAAALIFGCAGELDKDPSFFTSAFADGTPAGGSATGGSTGNTGGTTSTGGATSTGGMAGAIPPDDPCVASVITAKMCTSCHSTAAASFIGADLILEGAELGKRLSVKTATYKGVATSMNPGACVQGALLIDPVTPANSILLKKVAGTQVCGDKMPQGTGLSGDDLKCFTDWINKF